MLLQYFLLFVLTLSIAFKTRARNTQLETALFYGFSLFAIANLLGIVAMWFQPNYEFFALVWILLRLVDALTISGFAAITWHLSTKNDNDFKIVVTTIAVGVLLAAWGYVTYASESGYNYYAFNSLLWSIVAVLALLAVARASTSRLVVAGFATYLVAAAISTSEASNFVITLVGFLPIVGSVLVLAGVFQKPAPLQAKRKKN